MPIKLQVCVKHSFCALLCWGWVEGVWSKEVKRKSLFPGNQAAAPNAEESSSIIRGQAGVMTSACNGNTEKNYLCFGPATLRGVGTCSLKCCAGRVVLPVSPQLWGTRLQGNSPLFHLCPGMGSPPTHTHTFVRMAVLLSRAENGRVVELMH